MRLRSKLLRGAAAAATVMLVASVAGTGAAGDRTIPLTCTRGDDGQSYRVIVTMPASAPVGSTFTVRVDTPRRGPISHFGLNYLYNFQVHFTVPTGTTYVERSARIVPGTGSLNVRPGARVTRDARGIHMFLPGHVENDGSYTAPSIDFQVRAVGPVGSVATLGLLGTSVDASAVIIGNVRTVCTPSPRPYAIGTTRLVAATPPAQLADVPAPPL